MKYYRVTEETCTIFDIVPSRPISERTWTIQELIKVGPANTFSNLTSKRLAWVEVEHVRTG